MPDWVAPKSIKESRSSLRALACETMLIDLLVDEHWSYVGEFVAEVPDWSVGMEVVLADGRPFAIVAIVPNPGPDAEFAATWTVEPA